MIEDSNRPFKRHSRGDARQFQTSQQAFMSIFDSGTPWHADGLRFACTQCGQCCRIEGHVWVDVDEIRTIANHLGLEIDAFGRRYLRRIGNRFSLLDKPNKDCIFWDQGCSVYDARPRQCRTFPFWTQNLESPAAWADTARECEGIDEGRLYNLVEIESLKSGSGATADGRPTKPRERDQDGAPKDQNLFTQPT